MGEVLYIVGLIAGYLVIGAVIAGGLTLWKPNIYTEGDEPLAFIIVGFWPLLFAALATAIICLPAAGVYFLVSKGPRAWLCRKSRPRLSKVNPDPAPVSLFSDKDIDDRKIRF